MANWSKRRTTKAGNQGQRITRTTNSKGKSTYSFSKKVGNTRTTTSTSSSGKQKIYTTETHPTLGRKTTVRTVNPTPKKPKKPKKAARYKSSSSRSVSRSSSRNYSGSAGDSSGVWIIVGMIILLLMIFG